MTEEEWLTCISCDMAIVFLSRRASNRKLRLFACACCRLLGDLLRGEAAWAAVATAEDYADGRAKRDALRAARQAASPGAIDFLAGHVARIAAVRAAHEVARTAARRTASVVSEAVGYLEPRKAAVIEAAISSTHEAELCLLREIFGNPFRPVALAPACRTPAVLALAQAAYDERALPSGHLDADRLAVLADALEDAGATGDILAHLRSPGPHVRGCWALDLALGKE